jgi:hypothetical protein
MSHCPSVCTRCCPPTRYSEPLLSRQLEQVTVLQQPARVSSRQVSHHQSLRAVSASRLPDQVGRPCYPVCVYQCASCPSQCASPAVISVSCYLPVGESSRLPVSASRGVSQYEPRRQLVRAAQSEVSTWWSPAPSRSGGAISFFTKSGHGSVSP